MAKKARGKGKQGEEEKVIPKPTVTEKKPSEPIPPTTSTQPQLVLEEATTSETTRQDDDLGGMAILSRETDGNSGWHNNGDESGGDGWDNAEQNGGNGWDNAGQDGNGEWGENENATWDDTQPQQHQLADAGWGPPAATEATAPVASVASPRPPSTSALPVPTPSAPQTNVMPVKSALKKPGNDGGESWGQLHGAAPGQPSGTPQSQNVHFNPTVYSSASAAAAAAAASPSSVGNRATTVTMGGVSSASGKHARDSRSTWTVPQSVIQADIDAQLKKHGTAVPGPSSSRNPVQSRHLPPWGEPKNIDPWGDPLPPDPRHSKSATAAKHHSITEHIPAWMTWGKRQGNTAPTAPAAPTATWGDTDSEDTSTGDETEEWEHLDHSWRQEPLRRSQQSKMLHDLLSHPNQTAHLGSMHPRHLQYQHHHAQAAAAQHQRHLQKKGGKSKENRKEPSLWSAQQAHGGHDDTWGAAWGDPSSSNNRAEQDWGQSSKPARKGHGGKKNQDLWSDWATDQNENAAQGWDAPAASGDASGWGDTSGWDDGQVSEQHQGDERNWGNDTGWGDNSGSRHDNSSHTQKRGKKKHGSQGWWESTSKDDTGWAGDDGGWDAPDDGWGTTTEDYDQSWDELQNNVSLHKSTDRRRSQADTSYSMPSRTLAHAYKGANTSIHTVEPYNKINDYTDVRFLESKGLALKPVYNAFFGRARAARDRIHWMFPPNKDKRVSSTLAWVEKMGYNVGAYGLHKFLQSRERGALFVNADFHLEKHPNVPVFDWLTFDELQPTMDYTLQVSAAHYDPTIYTVVFIFLPSKTGNSVAIWRRKIAVPNNVRLMLQEPINIALSGLRRREDYEIYVDEVPKDHPGAAHQRSKSVPVVLAEQKKKRKWWQFFRSTKV